MCSRFPNTIKTNIWSRDGRADYRDVHQTQVIFEMFRVLWWWASLLCHVEIVFNQGEGLKTSCEDLKTSCATKGEKLVLTLAAHIRKEKS